MTNLPPPKKILGWREWVDLPDLGPHGLIGIKAKIDTGARSCALHASNIQIVERKSGSFVRFIPPSPLDQKELELPYESPLIALRLVRSSDGDASTRPVIQTHLVIGGEKQLVEVTLINRDIMGFKLLIGRLALRRKYLVDSGRSFLAPHPLNPRYQNQEKVKNK